MSLLWTRVASTMAYDDPRHPHYEGHDDHTLHPIFAAAGMKPAPCTYTRCADWDEEHSNAFDEAEGRAYEAWADHKKPPVEHVDLSKPVHGFEPVCDRHTLLKYTADPTSRIGGHPVWFRHKGQHYVMDGHHGTAAALRRGDSHLAVHMIDLDKDDD